MTSRTLGISAPEGRGVYEIYLIVKSTPGVLGKLSELIGKKGVDILGVHGQVSDDKQLGHIILYVEMKDSRLKIERLVDMLKSQKYVLEARSEPKNKIYFESMLFPLTSGGHYRVFTVGGASWVALIKSLLKTFGSAGASILHAEGVSVGETITERIALRFKETPDNETMIGNLKGIFKASGLGILDLSGDSERLEITVSESVVSESKEPVLDHFLVGVLTGSLNKIYRSNYVVEDLRYEDRRIRFRLRRT